MDNIVKKVCKELGITQKELAERLGVHLTTVQKWAQSNQLPEWAKRFLELYKENEKNKEVVNTLKKLLELIDYKRG